MKASKRWSGRCSPWVELFVPGSKSLTHRGFLAGALAAGRSWIRDPLLSDDTMATLDGLRAFGVPCLVDESGDVHIEGSPLWSVPTGPMDCGNSGTTLRFLLGQAARLGGVTEFVGDPSLSVRPNGQLVAALERLGARCESVDGCLPITVEGPIVLPTTWVGGGISSQYASSLCFMGTTLEQGLDLELRGPLPSRGYLDLTIDVIEGFGGTVEVSAEHGVLRLNVAGGGLTARTWGIEGDWSSAAFPLVAGVLTGRPVRVEGLDATSRQSDRAVCALLGSFGAQLLWTDGRLECRCGHRSSPGIVDVSRTPDLFPIMAVLCAATEGTTQLLGSAGLRDKESDRINVMAEGLGALGVRVRQHESSLSIQGGRVGGGRVETHGDHRVEMAFRTLGLVAESAVATNSVGAETVSYPEFGSHLALFEA